MRSFVVAKPVVLTRASIEGHGKTTYKWVPVFHYGIHRSNVEAKRAYIAELWPNMADAKDWRIVRFWLGEPSRLHRMKILEIDWTPLA